MCRACVQAATTLHLSCSAISSTQMTSEVLTACPRRHDLLERPLSLWNHLDIDFAEETRMCIHNRSLASPPEVAVSTALPLVSLPCKAWG